MALKSPRRGIQSIRRHHSAALGSFPSRSFYVDATNGNDANSGTHPDEAWQTIPKVSGETFLPGDRILFKRGETFSGTITIPSAGLPGKLTTLGAYGTGAAPILDGGVAEAAIFANAADRGYWRITELDIRCTADIQLGSRGIRHARLPGGKADIPGWIVEDCIFNCGIKISGENSIIRNNTFDGSGNAEAIDILWIINHSGNLIQNNVVHDCSGKGIWVTEYADDCVVEDNTVYNMADVPAGAPGQGINIDGWGGEISGVIVRRNTIYDCETKGIAVENVYGSPMFYDNEVRNVAEDSISLRAYDAHVGSGNDVPDMRGVDTNGKCYNNLLYENAAGWGFKIYDSNGWDIYHNTIADCDVGLFFDGVVAFRDDINFSDNIVHARVGVRFDAALTELAIHDYNCWYNAPASVFIIGNPWSSHSYAAFRAATGQDANSITADPLFVNAGADDYHIDTGSPCISEGVDVGIALDKDGVPRGDPPDIGAYQFVP